MKISSIASILILAVGALLGWRDQQRLATIRESHAKLMVEAASLGISLDPSNPADPVRITKRGRANRGVDGKLIAAEFIAFAKELETAEKNDGRLDETLQKRVTDFMDRMMSLDSSQLKILIAEVRENKELKDETRQGLIGFAIMTLADDHPQAALTLLTESADLLKEDLMSKQVISSSLAKWAKDDPLAALEWVRKNGRKFPDLIDDQAKRGLISGAAVTEVKLAFKLINELGLKDADSAIDGIIRAAKTPEDRTLTLAALREHLATVEGQDIRTETGSNAISELARSASKDGFASASQWIADAKFTPSELESLGKGLYHNLKASETGQWIEWIGANLPAGGSDKDIQRIVRNWTENDFQAAGKWLADTPEGPVKAVAIRSYAETVSRYDPETAAQWALTLPAGKGRDQTLKQIYQNWPRSDDAARAAAAAFAKQHGFK
jgi:hypothetical protein